MSNKRQTFPHAVRLEIAASQQWKCSMCRQLLPAHHHVDHIRPLHFGGTNDRDNLQCLCPNCHQEKTSKERLSLYITRLTSTTGWPKPLSAVSNRIFSVFHAHV